MFQSSTLFPPSTYSYPLFTCILTPVAPNLLLMRPHSYCCAGSFHPPPHRLISHLNCSFFWFCKKFIHYHSHFFLNHLSAALYPWNTRTYLFLNRIICSWCYKWIGAELVVWPWTCVTIAPVYSCIMFFKTIFIWITTKNFYLWKIRFASAGINSILFFISSHSVPTCCIKWIFMSGVKKSTAAAIIKLREWLTFQSCFQLLLIYVNFWSFYSFTWMCFFYFSNSLNKLSVIEYMVGGRSVFVQPLLKIYRNFFCPTDNCTTLILM